MNKKYNEAKTTPTALLLFLSLVLCGQIHAQHRPCAADEVNQQVRQRYPQVVARELELEAQIERQLRKMDLRGFARTTGDPDTTYHVPVVVHIMHNYGNENIPDNTIYQVIDRINKLYHKQNPDTADVIQTYAGNIPGTDVRYIGNANITFHLARKDPQGRPTRGITRTRTHLTEKGGDQSKLVQWPPNGYLNIWVVNTFCDDHSNAGAYAYRPGSAEFVPESDGVIISFRGTGGDIDADHTLGHEIGHFLNLSHVWGNNNDPEQECGDDAVDDTPPTKGHMKPDNVFDGCTVLTNIYDTVCTFNYPFSIGKPYLDTSHSVVWDTSTTLGVRFDAVTALNIDSVFIYPSAALGSPFSIRLLQNNIPVRTFSGVVTQNNFSDQRVDLHWYVPPGSNYKVVFGQNPGMYKDTILAAYNQGLAGTIQVISDAVSGRYNFFYALSLRHGYFRIYDSLGAKALGYPYSSNTVLINYPDTTNAQNVMDYTGCSKMFTNGQTLRMRATLHTPIASRNKLMTPANLQLTGITDASGNVLPVADIAPVADFSLGTYPTTGGDMMRTDKAYGCTNTNIFTFIDRRL